MKETKIKNQKAFTLIELLVVVAIIGLMASIVFSLVSKSRENARRTVALQTQRQLQKAVELYYSDMGFYPPDVNRGWDPGISKALPYNKDLGFDCATNSSDCPTCLNCPSDWVAQAQAKWKGPYASQWPNTAPWGGKYDYNNWSVTTTRYGCDVPPGIYIGTQRNYDDSNQIPLYEEQWFLSEKLDSDLCINGESQLVLLSF